MKEEFKVFIESAKYYFAELSGKEKEEVKITYINYNGDNDTVSVACLIGEEHMIDLIRFRV